LESAKVDIGEIFDNIWGEDLPLHFTLITDGIILIIIHMYMLIVYMTN